MNPMQQKVHQFMNESGGIGTLETQQGRELRAKLIMEEAIETVAALGFYAYANVQNKELDNHGNLTFNQDFEKNYDEFHYLDFIDGLCDLLYVTFGGAVNIGRDIEPHFNEVHRANMTKLSGGFKSRADGKILKPKGWQGPDHSRIIEEYPSYD